MSRHEHQLPGLRPLRPQRQEARRGGGLAVRAVGAQQRHVQAPARELEVVRVTAEGGDTALGGEYQAHVVVAMVLVQPVLPALVEVDGFALQRPGSGVLALLLAGLLELRQGLLAGVVRRAVIESADRRRDPVGDVFHAHQHVGDLRAALQFLLPGAREEAPAQQVLLAGRVLIQAALRAVVIGEDQSGGRYEGGGAVRQAERGAAHSIQPGGADVGAVLALHQILREVVEGPHAGVAERGR